MWTQIYSIQKRFDKTLGPSQIIYSASNIQLPNKNTMDKSKF